MTNPASAAKTGKRALIVVGMHRSGTSATTGALQCLGVQLGRKLYSGHKDINAKGYFEHSDIADANDEALLTLGSGWDDIFLKVDDWWKRDELQLYASKIRRYIQRDFSRSQLWAVKDPRVCRLLPWWMDILAAEGATPYFLFVVRSPAAVFRSLQRRDGFSRDKAYLLWALHYLEAERWSRGQPRAFVSFDSFLDDPVGQFRRVEQALGVAFPVPVAQATDSLQGFLSQDMRHHQEDVNQFLDDSPILSITQKLETQLQNATQGGETALDKTALDNAWQQMKQLQQAMITGPIAEHARSLSKERGQLKITINRLTRSWSWYTGKPVRFFERVLKRDV